MRDQTVRDVTGKYAPQPLSERFEAQYEPEPMSGCWLWIGVVDRGYGELEHEGRKLMAHRAAYILAGRSIPPRFTIDHLRRNYQCVNPGQNLEAVPHRVNVARSTGVGAQKARQTHCVHGHLLDDGNTYWRNGCRFCRACGNRRNREHRRRLKEKANGDSPAA